MRSVLRLIGIALCCILVRYAPQIWEELIGPVPGWLPWAHLLLVGLPLLCIVGFLLYWKISLSFLEWRQKRDSKKQG